MTTARRVENAVARRVKRRVAARQIEEPIETGALHAPEPGLPRERDEPTRIAPHTAHFSSPRLIQTTGVSPMRCGL
jgi:hypothetical protein